jgi:hypothetical protein
MKKTSLQTTAKIVLFIILFFSPAVFRTSASARPGHKPGRGQQTASAAFAGTGR